MVYLLIALGALALGPALLVRLRRWPAVATGLDGFVATAIIGLVFLQFVPGAVERPAPAILVALTVGFLLPVAVERATRDIRGRADRWGLLLGLTGLALHAALDGAALATVDSSGTDTSLAVAVILHRLPVGIAVWWLTSRALGRGGGPAALVGLMAATVLGFYFGAAATGAAGSHRIVDWYQAVVGGSLVHVVLHRGHALPESSRPRAEGLGALAALAVLLAVVAFPDEPLPSASFLSRFVHLSARSAPALLIAYLLSAMLVAFRPANTVGRSGGGALLRLDAILLSIPLLGPELMVVRTVAAGAARVLLSRWTGGGGDERGSPASPEAAVAGQGSPLPTRLGAGLDEVVDRAAPWMLSGLGVAALVVPWFDGGWLARLPSPVGVLLFAAVGTSIYVGAASATPLVATLLATGLSPGAGIAFLITGPATNLSTLGILSGLHGRRAAMAFASVLVAFAVAAGLAIDAVLPGLSVPTLAQLTEEAPSPLQLLSLAGLGLLFAASLLRRGMDGFIGEIREGLGMGHAHSHDHSHGNGHSHSHEHSHTH